MGSSICVAHSYAMKGHDAAEEGNSESKHGTHPTDAAMNIGTTCRYKECLANKKQNPQGEYGAMNMGECGKLWRAKSPFK